MVDQAELRRLRASFEKARDDLAYAEGFADAFEWIQAAKNISAEKRAKIPIKYSSVGALGGRVRP